MSDLEWHRPAATLTIRPGTQLSSTYEIDAPIAVGGMGEVFKGHNIETGDLVAIKIVLPEYARDAMMLELFRKEARILNHLAHDAIVRYYGFAIDRELGRPYLAMEFVEGPSLAERLKAGPLRDDEVVSIQRRLADGLQKAHEAGIIHRDISPDNIILEGGRVERAKIVDFGISRSAKVGDRTLIGTNFAGKYGFVSPEQLGAFGGEVTPRSDIYSLGLVLAAALLGRPLDMAGSTADAVEKRRTVPDLTGIDPSMHRLLHAMLEPDPTKRPHSMAAIRDWSTPGAGAQPKRGVAVKPSRVSCERGKPKTLGVRFGLVVTAFAIAVISLGVVGGWYYVEISTVSMPEPRVPDQSHKAPPDESEPLSGPPETDTAEPEDSDPSADGAPPAAKDIPNSEAKPDTAEKTEPVEPEVESPVIAIDPVPEPQPPTIETVSPDRAAELAKFLASFDGGGCFFAIPVEGGDDRGSAIIAYGSRDEPFAQLARELKTRFDVTPIVSRRMVTGPQCAVLDALRAMTTGGSPAPHLALTNSRLPVKASLEGRITGLDDRQAVRMLIDDEGGVIDISKRLKDDGDNRFFDLQLNFESNGATQTSSKSRPQLVLLIASRAPVESFARLDQASQRGSTLAAELMPVFSAGLAGRDDVAAAIDYFEMATSAE